ncbi:hypothetical protein ACIO93_35095 [Streptomyces sp. NPDC087903]
MSDGTHPDPAARRGDRLRVILPIDGSDRWTSAPSPEKNQIWRLLGEA